MQTVDNYHNGKSCNFFVHENCDISLVIKNNEIWEPQMHELFAKYINSESIVIEGGCHIGTHTIKLGLLAKQVYAFEPLPMNNELLRKNVSINNLTNVQVFSEGLADKSGNTTFDWVITPGASGLSNNPMGYPGHFHNTLNETIIDVKLTTIDELDLDKLDFIKLDVEGYEKLVILGGLKTIERCKPVITIEVWSSHFGTYDLDYTKNLFLSLIDLGYTIEHIKGPDFLFLPKSII